MRAVVQRVTSAGVSINGGETRTIGQGFLVLIGVECDDTQADCDYLARKISAMRIFSDEEGKMNRSISDVGGEMLIISNFTLCGDSRKGNRPSFINAARPEVAVPLYERFTGLVRQNGIPVKTGEFGADMAVSLVNDGPVTLIVDSRETEIKQKTFSSC